MTRKTTESTVRKLNLKLIHVGLGPGNNNLFSFKQTPFSRVKTFKNLKDLLQDSITLPYHFLDENKVNQLEKIYEECSDQSEVIIPLRQLAELSIDPRRIEDKTSVTSKEVPYYLKLKITREPGTLFKVEGIYKENM
jgi:hypothetical protein